MLIKKRHSLAFVPSVPNILPGTKSKPKHLLNKWINELTCMQLYGRVLLAKYEVNKQVNITNSMYAWSHLRIKWTK